MSPAGGNLSLVENFDVVQGLLRVAFGGNRDALLQQARRLQLRLKEQGASSEARSIAAMISRAEKAHVPEPLDLRMSSSSSGSTSGLQRSTALPVDRESGVPLCEIVFPSSRPRPILEKGTNAVVDALLEEWRNQELLRASGLEVSRSLLLYGAPGTGKTSLAIYLASEMQLPAVVARIDGLISSLLGSTARNLANLFDFANKYACVLVLDEFDAVAKVRDDPNEVGEIKRVVNALLQNLDRRFQTGLTVCITNHEALLDSAIWRRFEHQLQLGLPPFEARVAIASAVLKPHDGSRYLSRIIARLTAGQSGADVRALSFAVSRTMVLQPGRRAPVDLVRHAASSARARMGANLDLLGHSDQDLAREIASGEGAFSAQELAMMFDRDRRTIARWLQTAR